LTCCKSGWRKDSKEVTGRQTRSRGKKGRHTLRWMDVVDLDLNIGANHGEEEL
jgi:hypothetical protein